MTESTNVEILDVDSDPDHDPNIGLFEIYFNHCRIAWGNCKNFVGSAALAELCNLQTFVVINKKN